ncbi:MAG: MFS transporter [Paracoccaceae bacterium]|nr:MAG: MFS transporter [Paracoccaceae bacterium]
MDDATSATRGRWAVATMFLANGFVMGAWAPQIPLLLPRHGIGEATLGLLILVLGAGAVGAMLFCGRLIGRFGARAVLRTFMLAIVPVLPVVVFAPSVPLLAVAMALFGAMIGCMDVAMNANAVEVERRLGRAIMSSSHGFWSLGGFAGGASGSVIIARAGSEVQAMATAGITLALVLIAAPYLMAGDPPAARDRTEPQTRLIPHDGALWLLGALALLSMVPEGAVLDWAALYLGKELGAGVETSGLAFALFAGAMAVVRFAGDAIRNRFGAVRTLRVSGLIGAAGLAVAASAPDAGIAIAGFALAGLGVANMVPVIFSAAGNHPGLPSGAAISVVTMVGYAGILVAPSTIGFAAEAVGFRLTFGVLAALLLFVSSLAARAAAADAAVIPGAVQTRPAT